MELFRREDYLKKIRGFYDDDGIIKVITGVRRSGKSSLMHTIAKELEGRGVADGNIAFIDLDTRKYRSIKTPDQLETAVDAACSAEGLKYLFIDEIQNVESFEEVMNAFRTDGGWPIFITGSNSYLFSGELVTKLTGRYIEFEIQALTFKEYREMKSFLGKEVDSNPTAEFDSYILGGGFPKALEYDTIQDKQAYVRAVVGEIFGKDIRRRVKIRHASVFLAVQNYIINNFGSTTSLANILSDLGKQNRRIKGETLDRYLKILLHQY